MTREYALYGCNSAWVTQRCAVPQSWHRLPICRARDESAFDGQDLLEILALYTDLSLVLSL